MPDGINLFKVLIDRLNQENGVSPEESDDLFYDAAKLGGPEAKASAPGHPSRFLPDPLVIGQPDKARMINQLLNYVPDLKNGMTKRIVMGPTDGTVSYLANDGPPSPNKFENSELLGAWDTRNGDIALNPGFERPYWYRGKDGRKGRMLQHNPDQLAPTMVHELMHNRGWNDDYTYQLQHMLPKSIHDLMSSIQQGK